MWRKAFHVVLCWLTFSQTSGETLKTVNSSVVKDNISAESAPRLYRNVPIGVYASAAPYAAYSFHVPAFINSPKASASRIIPVKEQLVVNNVNGYLRDSYGNRFVETPQSAAYKTAFPQQFLPLQALPPHLAQPLLAQAQQPSQHYFVGSQYRLPTFQVASHAPVNSYAGYPQPFGYAHNIKSFAPSSSPPVLAQTQAFTAQQQPSTSKVIYSNTQSGDQSNSHYPNEVRFQRLENHPEGSNKSPGKQPRDEKAQIQAAPATVTAVVNGKKTVINIDTKPPVPLLDLSLLEPLTFSNPLVPQLQHFLPRINEATYVTLPEYNAKKNKKEFTIQRTKTYDTGIVKEKPSPKKQPKQPTAHDDGTRNHKPSPAKPIITVKGSPNESPEFSYEINSPNYKETYKEKSVSYNKASDDEPVNYSYDEKTQSEPISYSYTKSEQKEPVNYNIVRTSEEPVHIKQVTYEDNGQKPKQLVHTYNSGEQNKGQDKNQGESENSESAEDSSEKSDEDGSSHPQTHHYPQNHPNHPTHSHTQSHHLSHGPPHPQNHPHPESHSHTQSHHNSQGHPRPQSHPHQQNHHHPQKHLRPHSNFYPQSHYSSHAHHSNAPRNNYNPSSKEEYHHSNHRNNEDIHTITNVEIPRRTNEEVRHRTNGNKQHRNHENVHYGSNEEIHHIPHEELHHRPHKEVHYQHHHEPPHYRSEQIKVPVTHLEIQYPVTQEYEEDIHIVPSQASAPLKGNSDSSEKEIDSYQNFQPAPLSSLEQYQKFIEQQMRSQASTSAPQLYSSAAPVIHQKAKRIIIQEESPEETHSHQEQKIMAEMIEQDGNDEEDFEKSYKNAAYGFPAFESKSAENEDDAFNPANYGFSRDHGNLEIEKTPFQQYHADGDSFPKSSLANYKDAMENTKEDYFLDYSISKPESFADRYQNKANYYKLFKKYKPDKYFAGENEGNKERKSEKYSAAPSFSFNPTPQKKQSYYGQYKAQPHKYEYNYDKEAPRDNSAHASRAHQRLKTKIHFVEPQFQYGFEPIALPRLLDSELAAMASNDSPESEKPGMRKKVYKENWYIKKTSTSSKPS